LRCAGGRPVRQGLEPEPGPQQVPDLPRLQGDLRRVDRRRWGRGVLRQGPRVLRLRLQEVTGPDSPAATAHPPAAPAAGSTSAASNLPPAYPARAPWGTAPALRAWQAAALESYLERSPKDFLAVATPGAGKTTFALRVATELLQARTVRRVTVVAPTEHLKTQ